MKNKVTFLVCALCAMLMLAGCSKSPTKVVEKWHDAIIEQDLKTANECCTDDAAMLNSMMIGMVKKGGKDIEGFKKMEVVSENVQDKTATVKVKFSDGDTKEYDLVKIDGKWKISPKK